MEPRKRYKVEELTPEHVVELLPRLRETDVHELAAADGSTPFDAMTQILARPGMKFAWSVDGTVEAIFGATQFSLMGRGASPFLLGSDAISEHPREILTLSRRWMMLAQSKYAYLENWVHHENLKSLHWLHRIGFTVEKARPYGAAGERFHRFYWRR